MKDKKFTGSTNLRSGAVLMRIVPIKICYDNKETKTYAFMDEGSDVTLMDADLARDIGLKGTNNPLNISWTNGYNCTDNNSETLQLHIKGDNEEIFKLKNVRTLKNLKLPCQTLNKEKLGKKWPHLKRVTAENYENAEPKILIGQDNLDLIVSRSIIEGRPNDPIASRTKLGWIIHGSTSVKNYKQNFNFFISTQRNTDEELDKMMSKFFELEKFGIKENSDTNTEEKGKEPNKEDDLNLNKIAPKDDDVQKAEKIMSETCIFKESAKKWEIGLLWRDPDVIMPENKKIAEKRLKSVERDMDNDSQLAEQYCQNIEAYLTKDYAEKLAEQEAATITSKTWYLPHFPVRNPNKPNKFRFVFDAKAKSRGSSLNDHLLTGPDLLNSLPKILFKFREGQIGFAGDIKEMFLQIQIKAEDRNALRFLWRGMDRNNPPETYRMKSMIFGAACSPSCAIYTIRKNAERHATEFPEVATAVRDLHYMDDYVDSKSTIEDAVKQIKDTIEVHGRGGFLMTNWVTNSEQVKAAIPQELRKNTDSEKILGVCWDLKSDTMKVHVGLSKISEILNSTDIPTKRDVLKVIMAIYDPLGITAPITVKGKILLQKLWKAKIRWDEKIEEKFMEEYREITEAIRNIKKIEVPRCYSKYLETAIKLQSHTFCDASELAYAACVYFRMETSEGKILTAFVIAKTRVAPIKKNTHCSEEEKLTVPKLELQAAVLGAKLFETTKNDHSVQLHESFFWTDSQIALAWIQSKKFEKLPTFIKNRVRKIRELTKLTSWKWIPTKINVADEATRDRSTISSILSGQWLTGPSFLQKTEEKWPEENILQYDKLDDHICAVTMAEPDIKSSLPDIKRFSLVNRLVRATAWILRFIRNCKARMKARMNAKKAGKLEKDRIKKIIWFDDPKFQELTPPEIKEAEILQQKTAQHDSFKEEQALLAQGKPIPGRSRLFTLSPIMENGLLKIDGRLRYGEEIEDDTKNPIILDPHHPLTKLYIQHYHSKTHEGSQSVMCEMRRKFWILKGRWNIKKVCRTCPRCRFMKGKPKAPKMAPLPSYRLSRPIRPFTICGLDYFGPLMITIGRKRDKRYGALFTCLSTRAIHIEIAASLTTDSAIMALQRMICRRGPPEKILSDNGTNFHGAELELKRALEELDQNKIIQFCTSRNIEWEFNPPLASHFGGAWERMVKSVKTTLKCILNEQAPKEETLNTLLLEAEYTVNSRPLTFISDDPKDEECLTPNHFLIGPNHAKLPYGEFDDDDLILRKAWRTAQRLADNFWQRWTREYLNTLIKRPKWFKDMENIQTGDIVVLVDENAPRNIWLKGIVTNTFPGDDGVVRVVDIKTSTGVFRRPVTKIILIKSMKPGAGECSGKENN